MASQNVIDFDIEKYGFRDPENYTFKSEKGLNERVVRELSAMKGAKRTSYPLYALLQR